RGVPRGAWISIVIDGQVVDFAPPARLWQFRRKRPLSLHALGELAAEMQGDPKIRGVLVTIRNMGCGMAAATSLHAMLGRCRSSGREVVVHLPLGGDTKELYVASTASCILVGPQATLAPLGFSMSVRYVKGTLDKAGLEPQIVARGQYKSAGEQ